jgi:hypothetical protein
MKAEITIPDFSSISKRCITLPRHLLAKAVEPGSIVIVDSTGLKVYGKDEWHQEKHNVSARRTWRKLHLAIDENHQVLACELTTPEVGDPTAVQDLLDPITTPFDTFILKKSVEFTSAKNIQHKLDNPIGAIGTI